MSNIGDNEIHRTIEDLADAPRKGFSEKFFLKIKQAAFLSPGHWQYPL
jgi:hypothetical protein